MISSDVGSRLFFVGNPKPVHVGAHLSTAAEELAYQVTLFDSQGAFETNGIVNKLNWSLRGHRPSHLRTFSGQLVDACREQRPQWIVATGIAPIDESALKAIKGMGTRRLNYLTDDPWNPSHRAPWFMEALRHYDWVFSTRKSNIEDLREHGCPQVAYLPFAYAPTLHYCDPPDKLEERRYCADVVFAGGADRDRLPLLTGLIRAGFKVALYGGYWDRQAETRPFALGHADPATLRKAIGGAKVSLCLVRRANRDGSAMRTFEVAAMGACMLAEDTDEHREILGADGDAVVYFRTLDEMIDRLRWLLAHDNERRRLAEAVRVRITSGQNTYKDRLESMLAAAAAPSRS